MAQRDKGVAKSGARQSIEPHTEHKIAVHSAKFEGPLPHPSILREYDEIYPGLAERIVANWEKEIEHRHTLEQNVVKAEIEAQKHIPKEIRRGQYLAFVLSLGFLVAGVYMVAINQPIAGTVVSGTGFVGIIMAFLSTAFMSRKNNNSPPNQNEKTTND